MDNDDSHAVELPQKLDLVIDNAKTFLLGKIGSTARSMSYCMNLSQKKKIIIIEVRIGTNLTKFQRNGENDVTFVTRC